MIPRDRSKYGAPFSALDMPALPEVGLRVPYSLPEIPPLPPIMLPDVFRAVDCHHCGAPSPGKRCRFCGTGEAPALPPDTCPSCRSHVETVTMRDHFKSKTLVAEVCNCPTVTICEVPDRGAARLVETKPNPRFYQAVLDDSGKTIGYTTRKGGA